MVYGYANFFSGCEMLLIGIAENFCEAPRMKQDKIYSATGDGKVPFVSADDIARVAFHALTDDEPHNTDHLVLGPELLSYGDV